MNKNKNMYSNLLIWILELDTENNTAKYFLEYKSSVSYAAY